MNLKNTLLIFSFLFTLGYSFSQSPEKMSYQSVLRGTNNALVTNQNVFVKISILQGTISGTSVYVETHSTSTNSNGLISLSIGGGTLVSGSFSAINWANGPYFVQMEADPTGGTNYTISGTTQLLSVPYALYAKTAGTILGSASGPAPTVTTVAPTNVLATTVNTGLTIQDNGNEFILASGLCYGTAPAPTINNSVFSISGTWTGNTLTNLAPSTQYYARAFATNSNGTNYGNQISFTTISGNVTISTNPITSVTDSSFVSGGNITSDGGAPITQRGVCWSTTNTNPTIGANNYTNNGSGTGSFSTNNYNKTPNTLYYVRAYAMNAVGTFYGNTQSVTTLPNCSNLADTCSISSSFGNIALHGGRVYVNGNNINFSMHNLNLPISCSSYMQMSGSLNCSNSTFTIPSQTRSGCIISGTGFYNTAFNQLTVNYTIISGGNTYNCTSVYTHL
jgi:hypothetical protein